MLFAERMFGLGALALIIRQELASETASEFAAARRWRQLLQELRGQLLPSGPVVLHVCGTTLGRHLKRVVPGHCEKLHVMRFQQYCDRHPLVS